MKKLVSLLLCAVLMLSVISVGIVSAAAETYRVAFYYLYAPTGSTNNLIIRGYTDEDGYIVRPTDHDDDREAERMVLYSWYTDRSFKYEFDFSEPVDQNTILYARWVSEDDLCSVVWYLDVNATQITSGCYAVKGEPFSPPEAPGRDGETFFGWYTDRALTTPFDATQPMTGDVELFPRFVKDEDVCSVFWYLSPVEKYNTAGVEVPRGDCFEPPADPGQDYATFAGWYTDRACQNRYDPTQPIMQDTNLYAKWIYDENVCLITLYDDGTLTPSGIVPVLSGSCYEPWDMFVEGATFGGWFTDDKLTVPYNATIPITHDTSLYAKLTYAEPKITGVINGEGGARISWTDVCAPKYRVFRKSPMDTRWKTLATVEGTSYVDNTALSGLTYRYTVRCIDSDGTNYTSSYDATGFTHTYYEMSEVTNLTPDLKGMKLTLSKSKNVYGYRVFRKEAGKWKSFAVTTATTYIDTTVVSGNDYTYTVRCVDKNGRYLTDYDRIGMTASYVAAPKITSVMNTNTGSKVVWKKSGGAVKYRVFYKTTGRWLKLADTAQDYYVHTSAQSGTTYTYTVRALDSSGSYSSAYYSDGTANKFIAAPALPTLKNSRSGVKITVTMPKGAVRYCVFRKEVGTNKWVRVITNVSASTKIVIDKTAKNGKKYYYTVRCLSKDGRSYVSGYNTTGRGIACKR